MANVKFTRFFEKSGVDMNMGMTSSQVNVVYTQASQTVNSLSGGLFFPSVSVGLIETQQLYLLQEVTGPTSTYQLRNVPGSIFIEGGSPYVVGSGTNFTSLTGGQVLNIENSQYVIQEVLGATYMQLTTSPSSSISTNNVYYYDYLSYSEMRSSPGSFTELLNVYFENQSQTSFFLYNVDYTEDVPYIQKSNQLTYQLTNGSADSIDPVTGRIEISNPFVNPTMINIGISSQTEDIFQESLKIDLEQQYQSPLIAVPLVESDGSMMITIGGTSQIPYILNTSKFYLQGNSITTPGATSNTTMIIPSSGSVSGIFNVGPGISFIPNQTVTVYSTVDPTNFFTGTIHSYNYSTGDMSVYVSSSSGASLTYSSWGVHLDSSVNFSSFFELQITPISIGIVGSDTYLIFQKNENFPAISSGSFSSYRLLWKNVSNFATISLYGETEAEDERFKLVLQNFGRKLDFDQEYIFADSDINEGLPDYKILNMKRKELLLEGENIFPYIGSYKSLINVINFFGYYDLELKEYFLNVDSNSTNYGKYMHILVPRNDAQYLQVKSAWEHLPSSIYKKTSFFGLFYNLNQTTGQYDNDGIPMVEDVSMYSPDEVLIKLYGLQQLLQSQFLPVSARIIDISGEGIYFQRVRVDTWADTLNHLTVNIATNVDFTILPEVSYISDLRRIDQFYVEKFIGQGLTGFLGNTATNPSLAFSVTGGPQLLINGDFSVQNGPTSIQPWILGVDWSFGYASDHFTGQLNVHNPGLPNNTIALQPGILTPNTIYQLTYTISNYVNGVYSFIVGNNQIYPGVYANGTYTLTVMSGNGTDFEILAHSPSYASCNFSLSAMKLYQIVTLSSISGDDLGSYNNYLESVYDSNGNLLPPLDPYDPIWQFMPPPVYDPTFNDVARRLTPLPDTPDSPIGAPILLQPSLDIKWEDANDFDWAQLGILDTNGAPLNINIWTWDSIGRGQFIDVRWVITKGGSTPFRYDSGRLPLNDFVVQTRGATEFSIPATMQVTSLTGSSISAVQITNPGYGYSTVPNVQILGTTGATAHVQITLTDGGYIVGGTVSYGGSGYSTTVDPITGKIVYPTIIVDPPTVTYETTTKILHAVSLPYTGDYQVGMYLYDITNNFTAAFHQITVNSRNIDFVSAFKRETPERSWNDFQIPPMSKLSQSLPSGATVSTWDDVTGPWYFPTHVKNTWDDTQISWQGLEFSSYRDQSLFEQSISSNFVELNRSSEYVTLNGNLTSITAGDSLVFVRNDSDLIESNILVPPDSFYTFIVGVTASLGATAFYTAYDMSSNLSTGSSIFVQNVWYDVTGVDSTAIYTLQPIISDIFSQVDSLSYPYSSQANVTILGPTSMSSYSRIIFTDNMDVESIDPQTDYYRYVDGLTQSGSVFTVSGNVTDIRSLILNNSSLYGNNNLYASWGLFDGVYSILVKGSYLIGNNTRFILSDVNKYLYYLDGNFSISNADYDVDYAETKIGVNSLTYENSTETTWSDGESFTWNGLEYHPTTSCGFIIPFVAPGGGMTIDEFPSFQFSGSSQLLMGVTGAKTALQAATLELLDSTNEGIQKFDYVTLPEQEIYLTGLTGNVKVTNNGSTWIQLDRHPNNLKIPAIAVSTAFVPLSYSYSLVHRNGFGNASFYLNAAGLTGMDGGTISVSTSTGAVYDGTHEIESLSFTGVHVIVYTNTPYIGNSTGFADINSLSVSITNPGYGYSVPPAVNFSQGSTGFCTISNSMVDSLTFQPGMLLNSLPTISISQPEGYTDLDNSVWTGQSWSVVSSYTYSSKYLNLDTSNIGNYVNYTIPVGSNLLLPYNYHKQLINSSVFQEFYFFIHADAMNPSSEMLSYINFYDGVEGEWLSHPERTYSYPLKNSFSGGTASQDYLYKKWVYEGSDYPPLTINPDYISDTLSLQSRVPFSQTLQSAYSYNDTVVSSNQQYVPKSTVVLFNYDKCRIPGKNTPLWTIVEDSTGIVQVMSTSQSLMWNFTKNGTYSVSLSLQDGNGNRNVFEKTSFIVVGVPPAVVQPLGRQNLTPSLGLTGATASINIMS